MVEHLFTSEALISFVALASLEIVLGIDNIVFIAILTGKMPPAQQKRVRSAGLLGAMVMRIALLLAISWMMGLDKHVLFTIPLIDHGLTAKDLILLLGGLFLVGKAVFEIHDKLEGGEGHAEGRAVGSITAAVVQIMLLDLVFSIDSVITAVGMAQHIEIMIAAIVAAVLVMLAFSGPVCGFIEQHPTIKILALSFLILIGVMLVVESLGQHVSKGYIYFAMGFALGVELLNIRLRKVHKPVHLHQAEPPPEQP
ncbi:MAG: TerC family protein [Planctomycetes bacterium]|nr:TerC family protein [Planctomycetota bacterium]